LGLAPVLAVVMAITDRQVDYARQITEKLTAAGLRATLDERSEKINLKIREAQLQQVPYMLVVGDREAQNGQVSVRHRRNGDLGAMNFDEFLSKALLEVAEKVISG
jgi:threonyl-tRNA synthetase